MGMTSFAQAYKNALRQPVLPVIWAALSVFGIVAGPFGTLEALSFGTRLFYWPLIVTIAILVGAALRVIAQDYLGLRRYRHEAVVIAGLSTLILTPPLGFLTRTLVREAELAPSWVSMAMYVFVASMATSALRHAFEGRIRALAAEAAQAQTSSDAGEARGDEITVSGGEATPEPRLMARLDPEMRKEIIRLQTRDHYVDVVTCCGKVSLLMRFADAMAELEGIDGLQVHRSHWVARAGIRGLRRERGKTMLAMCDGALVPVSRTYLAAVEALGLDAAGDAPEGVPPALAAAAE